MAADVKVRFIIFLAVFAIVAICESVSPRRRPTVSRAGRWLNNLAIVTLDSLVLKIFFPAAAVGVAVAARQHGWGLFTFLDLPLWFSIPAAVLILDLVIYLQHLMFHAVPVFWRLHMVHHADLDFDLTTGLRFHPIEMILSMLIKMTVVGALGPPVAAVIVFEIILNGAAMFSHGNIFLPEKVDRYLRLLLVTPDMHRVHHSVIIRETNSNFSFNFSCWDRLFGTYRAQPVAGHIGMTIGVSQFRTASQVSFFQLLLLPFIGKTGNYSLDSIGKDPETIREEKK